MSLLAAAARRLFLARSIEGHAVRLETEGALVPPSCACCGADAAAAWAETWGAKNSLLVPYCDECRHHVAARRTRTLAVALSSSLLALTLAGALPLVWERISLGTFALLVAVGSSLPVLATGLRRRASEPGRWPRRLSTLRDWLR